MARVKICGIKRVEDAIAACECGADYIGFIFIEGTPRFSRASEVSKLIKDIPRSLRNDVLIAGLFKDREVEEVCSVVSGCALDMVQLQGEESPEECEAIKKRTGAYLVKALKVSREGDIRGRYTAADYPQCDYFVLDTFLPGMSGGTGVAFDWGSLAGKNLRMNKPFFVAGGLTPGNVSFAIRTLKPYGVDVSSGVETSPGKKDKELIREFIENAKAE
jgi:phosphoribosylanthranilate isomerase